MNPFLSIGIALVIFFILAVLFLALTAWSAKKTLLKGETAWSAKLLKIKRKSHKSNSGEESSLLKSISNQTDDFLNSQKKD